MAAADACPLCAGALAPEQDWCLRCGAAARTRLGPTPKWRVPLFALALLTAIAFAVLAVALVKLAGPSSSTRAPAASAAGAATRQASGITTTTPATTVLPATAAGAAAGGAAAPSGATTTPGTAPAPAGATSPAGTTATGNNAPQGNLTTGAAGTKTGTSPKPPNASPAR
jgi:hypothetical protein